MNKQQAAEKYADEKYPLLPPDEYESDFSFYMSQATHLEIEEHFIAGYEHKEKEAGIKAEELWDKHSQLIGTDIDELSDFAGRCVITQSDFKKAMAESTSQPSPPDTGLREAFDEIIRLKRAAISTQDLFPLLRYINKVADELESLNLIANEHDTPNNIDY